MDAEYEPRYLAGILFFNEGDYFEAHEVWEALWHKVGHHTTQGRFLKALIQLAAAQLKIRMGEEKPARRLLGTLVKILEEILPQTPGGQWM